MAFAPRPVSDEPKFEQGVEGTIEPIERKVDLGSHPGSAVVRSSFAVCGQSQEAEDSKAIRAH
ncbi:MAG: hypothetical protein CSA62_00310 [Planctomycetota bacterium]|nr:MAG: hypothetical protein CSA62_00310 [Planctomycetota bacterium]